MKWKRKTQERLGNYWFGGASYMTKGVQESLTTEEILSIIVELKLAVKLYQGIDYLQVFECDDGRKVWAIDQVPLHELHLHKKEHNYFTLLLPSEY